MVQIRYEFSFYNMIVKYRLGRNVSPITNTKSFSSFPTQRLPIHQILNILFPDNVLRYNIIRYLLFYYQVANSYIYVSRFLPNTRDIKALYRSTSSNIK